MVTDGASFTGGIGNLNGNFEAGSLTVNGGTLSTGGTTKSDGAAILSSGSIAVIGGTLSMASLGVSGGQLTQGGTAAVNVAGNAAFTGGTGALFSGTFNADTLAISGTSVFSAQSGSKVNVTGAGGLSVAGDLSPDSELHASFSVFSGGDVTVSNGASFTGGIALIANSATLNTDSLAISSTGVFRVSTGAKVDVTGAGGLSVAGELLPDGNPLRASRSTSSPAVT